GQPVASVGLGGDMDSGRHRTFSARAALASLVVVTAARASAAEPANTEPHPSAVRRILVSIPDRQLTLVENDRILRVYSVAVGAAESPSPVGTFVVINRITNP